MNTNPDNSFSDASVPMKIFQIVLVLLLLATVVLVLMQVFARYVLQQNIKGVEELARLTLVWGGFLGAGYALLMNKHMKVDFIVLKMKPKSQTIMKALNDSVLLIVGLIMVKSGMDFVIKKWVYPDLSITLLFPRSLYYLPIPCLGIILVFNSLKEFFITIFRKREAAE